MTIAKDRNKPIVTWREAPGWIAIVLGLSGIFLSYWEIREGNEREILYRIWDDVHELSYSMDELFVVGDGTHRSQESRDAFEMRLLTDIHAHTGLLDDRPLMEAAFSVSKAWAVSYRHRTPEARDELQSAVEEMQELMEGMLGTYQPDDWPPANSQR